MKKIIVIAIASLSIAGLASCKKENVRHETAGINLTVYSPKRDLGSAD
ncbi:hypothetical protein SNE25_23735 [Mucilaginibacter sabulilitoris]|uniref:Uncharacterized protein n=1 Tax=Mucilaginibacter sabulilitoris TaxID=1173583 RepID=A0ABZ0TGL8_9SPHI|nr:hypothetical protein [Mucilaginibacter sabulilitoris]WPU92340.1 hypothetical protein SNE25_23735 [Mucilaginibacter sabulilitoris]